MRHPLTILAFALALAFPRPVPAGPVEESQRRKSLELYKKGEELLKGEKFEQAAEQFKKAIELNRDLVLAHYGLGQSYMALKRFPDAVQAFTGSREAYFRLATIRVSDRMAAEDVGQRMVEETRTLTGVDGRGGTSKAVVSRLNVLRDLEQTKRLDNGNPEPPAEISHALAGAWFRQGNLGEAEKENKNALKSRPDFGEAHSNLAVIYLMSGRLPESRAEVEKAEKSGFTVNPKLKEELDRRAAAQ
jgi:tetratricopeptide (TPR) repeat protein